MKILIHFLILLTLKCNTEIKVSEFHFFSINSIDSKKLNKTIYLLPIQDLRELDNKIICPNVFILFTLPYCQYTRSHFENITSTYFSEKDLPLILKQELEYRDFYNKVEILEREKLELNKIYIQIELLETNIQSKQFLYSPFHFFIANTIFKDIPSRIYFSIIIFRFIGLPIYYFEANIKIRFKLLKSNKIIFSETYNSSKSLYENMYDKSYNDKKNPLKNPLSLLLFQDIFFRFSQDLNNINKDIK